MRKPSALVGALAGGLVCLGRQSRRRTCAYNRHPHRAHRGGEGGPSDLRGDGRRDRLRVAPDHHENGPRLRGVAGEPGFPRPRERSPATAVTLRNRRDPPIRDLVKNREPKPGEDRGDPEARRLALQRLRRSDHPLRAASARSAGFCGCARARFAMYLSRTLTLRSLPEIGRRFGRSRTHHPCCHAS